MLFIFSDSFFPPVLSGSWINTNKKIYEILKPVQKENVMHNTEEEPQISQASAKTAWALPTWIKKNKKNNSEYFSKYQRLLAFQAEPGVSQLKKRNRWKPREWVQPEVKTRARQFGAMTQCHESQANSEARSDHKCVSPFAVTVVKALDSEDSAETRWASQAEV